MKYKGQVIDRLDSGSLRSTRYKDTYEEAHHAAEALAKRQGEYMSDRYYIKVVELL